MKYAIHLFLLSSSLCILFVFIFLHYPLPSSFLLHFLPFIFFLYPFLPSLSPPVYVFLYFSFSLNCIHQFSNSLFIYVFIFLFLWFCFLFTTYVAFLLLFVVLSIFLPPLNPFLFTSTDIHYVPLPLSFSPSFCTSVFVCFLILSDGECLSPITLCPLYHGTALWRHTANGHCSGIKQAVPCSSIRPRRPGKRHSLNPFANHSN